MSYDDLEHQRAEAKRLDNYRVRHGMVPYVYQTWKRRGKAWRRLPVYGIRFHKVGAVPAVYECGGYRMVPVPETNEVTR